MFLLTLIKILADDSRVVSQVDNGYHRSRLAVELYADQVRATELSRSMPLQLPLRPRMKVLVALAFEETHQNEPHGGCPCTPRGFL